VQCAHTTVPPPAASLATGQPRTVTHTSRQHASLATRLQPRTIRSQPVRGGVEGMSLCRATRCTKLTPPRPSPRPAHAPPSPHAGTHSRTPHTHTMRKPHTHTRRPSAITRERYYCGPSANPPQPVDPRSRQLRDGHNTNLGKIKPGAPKKCAVQRLEFTSHNVGFISSHVSLYLVVPIESFSLCVHARDAFMIVEPSCI